MNYFDFSIQHKLQGFRRFTFRRMSSYVTLGWCQCHQQPFQKLLFGWIGT